jgi:hypothetical protein
MVGLALLSLISLMAIMLLRMSRTSEASDVGAIELEDQARRLLDRISYAIVGTDKEKLFPDPATPIHSSELSYEVVIGVEDGELVWGDPERIGLEPDDATRLVWNRNPGDVDQQRSVWCNVVRPFIAGEIPNGIDDNGNGLVDERGLSFTMEGNMVTIRVTLERMRREGPPLTQVVETTVRVRN